MPSFGTVSVVLDGDTIILRSGEKIRYLGIDAPEIAHDKSSGDCYGEEAKKINADLVLNKKVKILYDRQKIDDYSRLLGYVYLPDGRCANEEMIKSGAANVFRSGKGFSKFDDFLLRQREAIRSRKGLWGNCPVKPEASYIANQRSYVFHRPGCRFGQSTAAANRVRYQTRLDALDDGYSPCRRCKP
ncbi:MAG: thermonuclease family protein [Syntrophobacteraceae bacterium]